MKARMFSAFIFAGALIFLLAVSASAQVASFNVSMAPRLVIHALSNHRPSNFVECRQTLSSSPPTSVDITGPTKGIVQAGYDFTAAVSPATTTLPITYVWHAEGELPVVDSGGLSDTVTFTWHTAGPHTITVRALNAGGWVSSTHLFVATTAPPSSVDVTGPRKGVVQWGHAFTATVNPVTTTQPITYVWRTMSHSPLTTTGSLTDTVAFTWDRAGTQAITVTATNAAGTVVGAHTITAATSSLLDVTIAGPTVGFTQSEHSLAAIISPVTATQPISYTWRATEQAVVTNTRGPTDTVRFIWDGTGPKVVTVTAANVMSAVTDAHVITVVPARSRRHLPLVLRNHQPGPVVDYFHVNVAEADPGDTITLTWESSDATTATLYHIGLSGQYAAFWKVQPSGSMSYDIPPERRNWEGFDLFARDDAGRSARASVWVSLTCPDGWFFWPGPDDCPSGPPVYTDGAEEHFEHGAMLWVKSEDLIYVLFDDGISPAWKAYVDEWEEGDVELDPSLNPPPGLYQPVRGFGLVWREEPGVRDRLGWAIDEERRYDAAFQRTSRWKYNDTYIRALEGGVWQLGAWGGGWTYIP